MFVLDKLWRISFKEFLKGVQPSCQNVDHVPNTFFVTSPLLLKFSKYPPQLVTGLDER